MNETRQQKLEYLTDNGYLHNLRGELGMSTKTLSLLTKLPEDMFSPPSSQRMRRTEILETRFFQKIW